MDCSTQASRCTQDICSSRRRAWARSGRSDGWTVRALDTPKPESVRCPTNVPLSHSVIMHREGLHFCMVKSKMSNQRCIRSCCRLWATRRALHSETERFGLLFREARRHPPKGHIPDIHRSSLKECREAVRPELRRCRRRGEAGQGCLRFSCQEQP
eukprot:SAG11_NODE_688_length_7716_cov_10.091637_2_plen_156_part_00